jgi:hypothetical protein
MITLTIFFFSNWSIFFFLIHPVNFTFILRGAVYNLMCYEIFFNFKKYSNVI